MFHKRHIIYLLFMLAFLPALAKGTEKGKIKGTIASVSQDEIVVIDHRNKEYKIPVKKHVDITISQIVPSDLLYNNAYGRIFGDANLEKGIIITDRIEFYDPNPGWGKRKIDKFGATGFLSYDDGVISIEVDKTILKVQWKDNKSEIKRKKTGCKMDDLQKSIPVKVEYISDDEGLRARKISADLPEMKSTEKQVTSKAAKNMGKGPQVEQSATKQADAPQSNGDSVIINKGREKVEIKMKAINTGHNLDK